MSKGIVKFYYATEKEEGKVIDSNSRIEKRLKELAEKAAAMPAVMDSDGDYSQEMDPDGFMEGLDAVHLDALTADEEAVNPEDIIAEAQQKADEIVATAEQLAREYKENSRREAEIECARIRADAKQEGYQSGIQDAQNEYFDRMKALELKEAEMMATYETAIDELEPQFVQTITDIYEHIIKVDFSEYQTLLLQLVNDTIKGCESSRSFIVHISPEDYSGISQDQKEELQAAAPSAKVDIVEDMAVIRNQCLLETDNGVIDCGLDTQLRELKKKLMLLAYSPN